MVSLLLVKRITACPTPVVVPTTLPRPPEAACERSAASTSPWPTLFAVIGEPMPMSNATRVRTTAIPSQPLPYRLYAIVVGMVIDSGKLVTMAYHCRRWLAQCQLTPGTAATDNLAVANVAMVSQAGNPSRPANKRRLRPGRPKYAANTTYRHHAKFALPVIC